jgi:hypothetical protein
MSERARPSSVRVAFVLALAPMLGACPRFAADLCDGAGCGAEVIADAGPAPIDDHDDAAHAVHVAPNGSDLRGDGSPENPVQTLARALTLTTADRSYIRVCEGTYAEALALTSRDRVVTVTGSYACPGSDAAWTSDHGTTRFVSAESHRIEAVGGVVRHLTLERSDASGFAQSCVALVVATRGRATLLDVDVRGNTGTPGVSGSDAFVTAAPGADGLAASGLVGGARVTTDCAASTSSTGGRGGSSSGGNTLARGESGTRTPPGALVTNSGVEGGSGRTCGSGLAGADGATLDATAAELSAFDSSTLVAASGATGASGNPGQGGGGGGTAPGEPAAPSGASGGCGGEGGRAGGGGGSSVGLLVRQGLVELLRTRVTSGDGGRGGDGGSGANGARGGHGIPQPLSGSGGPCGSGDGGAGSGGGGGSGGQGGWTMGIVVVGTGELRIDGTPVTEDRASDPSVTLGSVGAGGTGGPSGANGRGAPGVRAHDGKAGGRQAIAVKRAP